MTQTGLHHRCFTGYFGRDIVGDHSEISNCSRTILTPHNQVQERIFGCISHKAKIKFLQCRSNADADADAEMPIPRFPSGRFHVLIFVNVAYIH